DYLLPLDEGRQQYGVSITARGAEITGVCIVKTDSEGSRGAIVNEFGFHALDFTLSADRRKVKLLNVMERLDRGRLDFGVLIQPVDISKYDSLPLPVKDTWGLLMRNDHPLAAKTEITPADMEGLTLLISRQILNHDESQNPWLQWIGKTVDELDIALTYNLIFNAALLVRAGVGCAVTLDKLVNATAQSDLCFRPFLPRLESSLDIVWKKHQVFSSAAAAFLEEVRISLSLYGQDN
ncbi:MAG: LysR family transcriptional regulator substrate-binding protein, partial [Victivallales bacterium]|nr:LysR family transcriptional regulator substrate-binding protein [Victivallales bacterium]